MVEVGFKNRHLLSRELSQVIVLIVFKQEASLLNHEEELFLLTKEAQRDSRGSVTTFISIHSGICISWAPLMAQLVKNPPATWETLVWPLGWADSLENGTATHSSILAWRIPWTIVHGVKRVGHNWATFTFLLKLAPKLSAQVREVARGASHPWDFSGTKKYSQRCLWNVSCAA